jgi:hypothetical protein
MSQISQGTCRQPTPCGRLIPSTGSVGSIFGHMLRQNDLRILGEGRPLPSHGIERDSKDPQRPFRRLISTYFVMRHYRLHHLRYSWVPTLAVKFVKSQSSKEPSETRLVQVRPLFYRTEILSQHNFGPKELLRWCDATVEGPTVSTTSVVSQKRALLHAELYIRSDKKPVRRRLVMNR